MSTIWLQSNPYDKYIFLVPNSKAKLCILIIRSPYFGFKDRTALANIAKCFMGKFYNEHFPKSFHKLSEAEAELTMKTLKLGYSDDIMTNIYLQQIQDEDINLTFEQPENWNKITIIEKANLLLQANFLSI